MILCGLCAHYCKLVIKFTTEDTESTEKIWTERRVFS
jgi:hypothetical protein